MFDVAPTEFLLVAVIALVVIGPKDLPKAMRVLGYWVGRMRGVARQFRSGFDSMVREAELEEMEKRWAAENARIMAEHGAGAQTGSPEADPVHDVATAGDAGPPVPVDAAGLRERTEPADHDPFAVEPDATAEPIHVEKPQIRPAPGESHPPTSAGVTS